MTVLVAAAAMDMVGCEVFPLESDSLEAVSPEFRTAAAH
jgi:hypothetical protein